MIRIIVVEDEKKYVKKVKDIVTKISIKFESDIDLKIYSKFNSDLEKEINEIEIKKIYIIDIELDNSLSGIDIANKIRECDWDSEIIFATNHDKMFETVYRNVVDVFDFIEKFHEFDKKLEFDLNKIFEKNFDNEMFTYKNGKVNLQIYYRSILYICRDKADRKLILKTKNNSYILNDGLYKLLAKLDSRFVLANKSCIVNKTKIVNLDWSSGVFTLETGEQVPLLSKNFKNNF